MDYWPEAECSDEEYLSALEEYVKEIKDTTDQMKRVLSIFVNVSDIINYLDPPLPIPDAKPDDNKVLDDDDYDDMVDGVDGIMLDGDDAAEVAKKLDADDGVLINEDEVGKKHVDDDRVPLTNEERELVKKLNELTSKQEQNSKELNRIRKVNNYLMRPLAEPQFYCPWYDYFEDIASLITLYEKKVRKGLDSYYMKLYGRGFPKPLPDIDFMAMVKQYKLKFEQHHLLEGLNRKQGQAKQQQQQLQKI